MDVPGRNFAFGVYTDKTHLFCAESMHEREAWMDAIAEMIPEDEIVSEENVASQTECKNETAVVSNRPEDDYVDGEDESNDDGEQRSSHNEAVSEDPADPLCNPDKRMP